MLRVHRNKLARMLTPSGVFVGTGSGTELGGLLGSEYGSVPTLVYASLSWFF